jgi:membrane-associated phospholipid phosphatase
MRSCAVPAFLACCPLLLGAADADPFDGVLAFTGPVSPTTETAATAPGNGQVWFGSRVVLDTWGIVAAPLDWSGRDWAVAGGAVAATVATGLWLDRSFQSESQENRNPDKDRWSGAWGQLGTIYSFVVLGAAGTYGWLADDGRGVDVMVDGLEASVIASGILCPLLKYTVGRSRPNQTAQDTDVFAPFSGAASFPSGHTTQAFTVAAVAAFTYDDQPLVGGLAFAAATGVGLSRINSNAHYASDVVAGAILGTWVGYEVVRANRARRGAPPVEAKGFTWDLLLAADRQGISATWRW